MEIAAVAGLRPFYIEIIAHIHRILRRIGRKIVLPEAQFPESHLVGKSIRREPALGIAEVDIEVLGENAAIDETVGGQLGVQQAVVA